VTDVSTYVFRFGIGMAAEAGVATPALATMKARSAAAANELE
jgi:hypothetical protein